MSRFRAESLRGAWPSGDSSFKGSLRRFAARNDSPPATFDPWVVGSSPTVLTQYPATEGISCVGPSRPDLRPISFMLSLTSAGPMRPFHVAQSYAAR
jgi:hypothetical protein